MSSGLKIGNSSELSKPSIYNLENQVLGQGDLVRAEKLIQKP
jgi:hypothetical protein